MDKQLVVCPYNASLLSNKKKKTAGILNKMKFQMNLKTTMQSERSMAERSTYYVILFMWNSKKLELIYKDRKQISGCLWILAEGGMDYKGVIGQFREREITVNLIMVMVSWVYYICQNG